MKQKPHKGKGSQQHLNQDRELIVDAIYEKIKNNRSDRTCSREKVHEIVSKYEKLLCQYVGKNYEFEYRFVIPFVGDIRTKRTKVVSEHAKHKKTQNNTLFQKTFNEIFKKVV